MCVRAPPYFIGTDIYLTQQHYFLQIFAKAILRSLKDPSNAFSEGWVPFYALSAKKPHRTTARQAFELHKIFTRCPVPS